MSRFSKVAILGAGTMGHALALVHALSGCSVRLQDIDTATLERAPQLIDSALSTLGDSGSISEAEAAAALARISCVAKLDEAVAGADLVVEAVVEDVAVKRQLFAAIDQAAPPDAVIASNTSYLDVFPLIPQARQPRAIITHWYTPPYIIDLVDIVAGPEAEAGLALEVADFYRGMGKQPVVLERMISGYIANRLQQAMTQEILRLLDEGWAGPAEIDASIRHGLGLRLLLMGQLKKADYTGLDMMRRALANGTYTPPEPIRQSPTLERLIEAGRTGVMSGRGFYDYEGRSPEALLRTRDQQLLALKRALSDITKEEPVMIRAELTGRTALVTGGASGIGLACVTLLARSGARVAMNHLPGDPVAAASLDAAQG